MQRLFLCGFVLLVGSQISKAQTVSFSLSSCAHSGPAVLQGSDWTGMGLGDKWDCTITVPGLSQVELVPYILSVEGTAESLGGASFHVESPAGMTVGTLKIPDTSGWIYKHHREQQWQHFVTESFGSVLLNGGTDAFILVLDSGAAILSDSLTITDTDPIDVPLAKTSFLIDYGGNDASEGNGSHTESVTPALSFQQRETGIYATDGEYTLKFSAKAFFFSYPGYFEVQMTMGPQDCAANGCVPRPCPTTGCTPQNPGSQQICSRDGWPNSDYSDVTINCPLHRYLVIDQSLSLPRVPTAEQTSSLPITITFFTPGWPVYIKDVSLTFTPRNLGTCVPLVPPLEGACQP